MLTLLLFLAFLVPTAAIAESPLDWTALEVTAEDEEEIPERPEADKGRLTGFLGKMHSDLMAYKAEKNRRVLAVANKETVFSALEEVIADAYPGGVNALLESQEKSEEDLYRLIKTLPSYAYQYVGPFLHELPYMSERILNMPGIKETKGKFPTRIAPQMQAYAKKYGKYMSKHLYIYLMPEAWATEDREPESFKGYTKVVTLGDNAKPSDLFILNQASLVSRYGMPSPDDYRTGKALQKNVRPQTPANKVTAKSPLTEGDVEASLASFAEISQVFGSNRFDAFHTAIRDLSLTDNNLMEELRNPMQTLADKIKRLPEAEKFSRIVAKHGFTLNSWALTADKIIKARRVATMTPATALSVGEWRKMKKMPREFQTLSPQDRQTAWDSIKLYVDLYTSTEQNVLAVRNYGDNIRKEFATRDMTVLEAPVYGIY